MISFYPVDHWHSTPLNNVIDQIQVLCDRYQKSSYYNFPNGRIALDLLFTSMHLHRQDEVWILSTFDLPNISSCVTSTVFNHCKPSRVYSEKTKAILIIHEFGIPHPDLLNLSKFAKEKGIPLIEDCAHTMDSCSGGNLVGTIGDWTLFSYPKIFPMKIGGGLLGNNKEFSLSEYKFHQSVMIQKEVSTFYPHLTEYSEMRRQVFSLIEKQIRKNGLKPFIKLNKDISPWFFPFETKYKLEYLENAKNLGIDCAQWHGTEIIILPCHQFLSQDDILMIGELIKQTEGKK